MKAKVKRGLISLIIVSVLICTCPSVSSAAIRSASTDSVKLSNGFTVSGKALQFDSYMYGFTTCSNINAGKKVINTYYYYVNGTLVGKSSASSYVVNGFETYSFDTNFVSDASGKVAGIKGQHLVKYSSNIIWSDSCWAGTIN